MVRLLKQARALDRLGKAGLKATGVACARVGWAMGFPYEMPDTSQATGEDLI
jgi:hypothetical protein